jgi:hypothetical protein
VCRFSGFDAIANSFSSGGIIADKMCAIIALSSDAHREVGECSQNEPKQNQPQNEEKQPKGCEMSSQATLFIHEGR